MSSIRDTPSKPLAHSGSQAVIGLTLALAILATWGATHIATVFFYPWTALSIVCVPLIVAFQCWLYVGMFIVAHDCMHGSLVPFRPRINRAVGRLCLMLYAGFWFDTMNRQHHLHHRHSGTADDPDFDATPPYGFWHWYLKFFVEYFSWTQIAILSAVFWLYFGWLGAPLVNTLVFWTLPAILSSLQLFTFGTYLPHRPAQAPFADRHQARSNEYSWLMSLLSCFHFGYHHAHHLEPGAPWWRLPAAKVAWSGKTGH